MAGGGLTGVQRRACRFTACVCVGGWRRYWRRVWWGSGGGKIETPRARGHRSAGCPSRSFACPLSAPCPRLCPRVQGTAEQVGEGPSHSPLGYQSHSLAGPPAASGLGLGLLDGDAPEMFSQGNVSFSSSHSSSSLLTSELLLVPWDPPALLLFLHKDVPALCQVPWHLRKLMEPSRARLCQLWRVPGRRCAALVWSVPSLQPVKAVTGPLTNHLEARPLMTSTARHASALGTLSSMEKY